MNLTKKEIVFLKDVEGGATYFAKMSDTVGDVYGFEIAPITGDNQYFLRITKGQGYYSEIFRDVEGSFKKITDYLKKVLALKVIIID